MTTLSTALKAATLSRTIDRCMALAAPYAKLADMPTDELAAIACAASQCALDVEDENGVLMWFIFHNEFGRNRLRFDDEMIPTALDLIKMMTGYYGWATPVRPALRAVA